MRLLLLSFVISSLALAAPAPVPAAPGGLSAAQREAVDALLRKELAASGVPGASVALVVGGKLAYVHAYGRARLSPSVEATPAMRYGIGSISKQFTAAALLLLQEDGKVSLDAKLSTYLPNVPHAQEVTVRELLAQVTGYPDYWPQDYVPPAMLAPISREALLQRWTDPLDFAAKSRWEYSNTNYVLAGMVAEKVSGQPLYAFLQDRLFRPLGMKSVVDVDTGALTDEDAAGYRRFALGPPRPAPKEGKGWLFAMAELGMTAEDLARWDLALVHRAVLKPSSYEQLWRPATLATGEVTHYGLGVTLGRVADRRALSHEGEISGFTAINTVFPDDGAALVVLVNQDATGALLSHIEDGLARVLFNPEAPEQTAHAKQLLKGLQHGRVERALLTDNARAYFSEEAVRDFARSLGPLGPPKEFEQTLRRDRGGMVFRYYKATFAHQKLSISTYVAPDGRIEQFQIDKG